MATGEIREPGVKPSLEDPGSAGGLDHVGVAGQDLAALAVAYERLGFTLTPRARHSGRRTPEGPVEPFGTGNRCIMLRRGYIELIAILDPSAFNDTLEESIARYPGIHIVALSMTDEAANLARLRRAGFAIPGIAYLERPVADAEPDGPKARFARLFLPDAPEGRVFLIRHLTPEAIWQERFLSHLNRAVALEEVIVAVAEPAETGARFSRLAGQPLVPDPAGGYALAFPGERVRLVAAKALAEILPGVAVPSLPFIAGLTVRTDDGNAAISRIVAEQSIRYRPASDGLLVDPSAAGGAALLFRAGGDADD
jgi:hypothetical protein